MCGFYLNELMLRLLPREDAHEALFEYYEDALAALAKDEAQTIVLRRFEVRLLQELGYAMLLTHNAENGEEIEPQAQYMFMPERGAVQDMKLAGVQLAGKTLLDMAQDDYTDVQTQQQSKQLMRALISHHLGDKPLHTRQLLIDLQQL